MAENQEKTEAEILEETMQNLGLEEDKEEVLEEIASPEIEEVLEETTQNDTDDIKENIEETKDEEEKLVEEINLNNNKETKEDPIAIEKEDLEIEKAISTQKKQSKIQRVLVLVAGVLFLALLAGAVLYFMGFFDPEVKKEIKVEKVEEKKEEYQFNTKDIDPNRLNKKLNLLTKYEIVENSDIEEEKKKEKERLYLEAKQQLELERQAQIDKIKEAERIRLSEKLPTVSNSKNVEEAIDKEIATVIENNDTKEEMPKVEAEEIDTKEENIPDTKKEEVAEPVVEVEEEIIEKEEVVKEVKEIKEVNNLQSFIKVIKISTKQKDIYKSYLDKLLNIDSRITLCRDDKNFIEIFVGPFENEAERDNINKKYINDLKIDAQSYDFTQEEYDKRCNY